VAVLSPPYAKAYPTDQKANPPPALSNKFHNNTVLKGKVSSQWNNKTSVSVKQDHQYIYS
jgi:hypothetical protein